MKIETLQWNLNGGKIRKPEADPLDEYAYCEDGLDYIAEHIGKFNPDIVTLQEVHKNHNLDQAQILSQELGYPYFFNDPLSDSHREDGMKLGIAVLSRYPLLNHLGTFFDNPNYQVTGPKGELWLTHDKGVSRALAQLDRNLLLEVVTLHLFPFHMFKVDILDESQRGFVQMISGHLRTQRARSLIQGDFNIDTPKLKTYLPGLVPADFEEVTINIPTTPKGRILDHVLYKGIKHLGSEVVTGFLTDHDPILSQFEVA